MTDKIFTSYVRSYSRDKNKTMCGCSFVFQLGNHYKNFHTRGVAYCSPEDTYDWEFGKELAESRAMQKAFKRYERELIEYTYKDKWVKEINLLQALKRDVNGSVLITNQGRYRLERINDK